MCRILWSLIGSLLKVPRNRRCVSQKALWDCPAMLAKMNRGSECVINKFSKFAQKVRGKKLWVQHELLRYKAASIVKCLYTNKSWEICAKYPKIQAKWSSQDTKVHKKRANCLVKCWSRMPEDRNVQGMYSGGMCYASDMSNCEKGQTGPWFVFHVMSICAEQYILRKFGAPKVHEHICFHIHKAMLDTNTNSKHNQTWVLAVLSASTCVNYKVFHKRKPSSCQEKLQSCTLILHDLLCFLRIFGIWFDHTKE